MKTYKIQKTDGELEYTCSDTYPGTNGGISTGDFFIWYRLSQDEPWIKSTLRSQLLTLNLFKSENTIHDILEKL